MPENDYAESEWEHRDQISAIRGFIWGAVMSTVFWIAVGVVIYMIRFAGQ